MNNKMLVPSRLESIDEEKQRTSSQILLIADESRTIKKYGNANRGSMLPSIPFGNVGKINNSKAVSSKLYKASNNTMQILGILNKAGIRIVF